MAPTRSHGRRGTRRSWPRTRDDREAVEAACAEVFRLADAANVRTSLWTTGPLGLLELSAGHAELAADLLAPAADLVTLGIREPSCNVFLSDLIEALATVGREDEADALLRPYLRAGQEARPSPGALGGGPVPRVDRGRPG